MYIYISQGLHIEFTLSQCASVFIVFIAAAAADDDDLSSVSPDLNLENKGLRGQPRPGED